MSSSALPPLGNLPSWSRVSTLDRSRYPKPFLRDRLQTLPPPGRAAGAVTDASQTPAPMDFQFFENLSAADQQRLVYYNKSVKFLQQQHADTLKKLHEEIDQLKQANKDLQFKYVMGRNIVPSQDGERPTITDEQHMKGTTSDDELQHIFLQEEIKDLQQALKNAQGRNTLLQHALQIQNRRRKSSTVKETSLHSSAAESVSSFENGDAGVSSASVQSSMLREPSYLKTEEKQNPLPYGATLNPLMIQKVPELESRPPSYEECEVIINYLHKLSERQSEENQLLKSDLRELLYSNKFHRGAMKFRFETKSEEPIRLPKVTFKQNLPDNNSTQSGNSTSDRVSLPALKNSINTNVADRKKRQQAVQKARMKRDSYHQL